LLPKPVNGSVVRDLYYGETLFHFYQDEHFDALTHLLVARDSGRVSNHEAESELLLGGLYLHYGQHVRAEQIFSRLLQDSTEAGGAQPGLVLSRQGALPAQPVRRSPGCL
jgi:hypothetical protein